MSNSKVKPVTFALLAIILVLVTLLISNLYIKRRTLTNSKASTNYNGYVAPGVQVIRDNTSTNVTPQEEPLPEDLPTSEGDIQIDSPSEPIIHYHEPELPH